MSDNQRRGPLDRESKRFIEENSADMTVEEIAVKIRRNPRSVRKYIADNGLKSYVAKNAVESEGDKIRRDLKQNPWWERLKDQFSKAELIYFENLWVTLNKQLECDVLDSEKLQMKKYLTLEILKDRLLSSQQNTEMELEECERLMMAELNKADDDRDRHVIKSLSTRISDLKNLTPTLLKEFKDLSQEQDKVNAALKMSRDDRVKSVKDSKNSWTGVVKLLEDPIYREKVGKHIEIHAAAQKQELARLMSTHRFVDESYDQPLLSGKYNEQREEESANNGS